MVTPPASSADAAVVLVDATKLDWKNASLALLPQTRRHSLLVHLLRVHSLVFAVNKLDAVEDPRWPSKHIRARCKPCPGARHSRARHGAGVGPQGAGTWSMPMQGWCGYTGPTLLQVLEELPNTPADTALAPAFPVQWVENFRPRPTPARAAACSGAAWLRALGARHRRADLPQRPAGHGGPGAGPRPPPQDVAQAPAPASSSTARWTSRAATGFWPRPRRRCPADDDFDTPPPPGLARQPRAARHHRLDGRRAPGRGRVYWALHGHRWVKAKVKAVVHKLNINTLAEEAASSSTPTPSAMWNCCCKSHSRCAVHPGTRAGRADPGGHRQPQDRWRGAGELTQPQQNALSPLCGLRGPQPAR